MRVFYVGDVAPADTTSGAKLIFRHLRRLAEQHGVTVAHWAPAPVPGAQKVILQPRPWAHRALASRRRRHFEALDSIYGIQLSNRALCEIVAGVRPDAILTVAQGGLCNVARRVASGLGLPLITFFHDWSPDWHAHPEWSRGLMDGAFLKLYRASARALCICDGMREMLGRHPHADVLLPIPETSDSVTIASAPLSPSSPLVYAGALNGFSETEIRALGEASLAMPQSAGVALYGPNPHWGDTVGARILSGSLYRGLLTTRELPTVLASAGCLLVAMPFAETQRRIATTSFPSKISEYCAYGRPIVVWAPVYSSAARWAAESGAALLVTQADPAALLTAVRQLLREPTRWHELGRKAQAEANGRFSVSRLQAKFETSLARALPTP